MEASAALSPELRGKLENLKKGLKVLGSTAVAFSGGVDSTLLLKTAHDVLGDRAVAVTASSRAVPERELKEAEEFCKSRGIRQIIFPADELQAESFLSNSPDRCYFCKKAIFTQIGQIARENHLSWVTEGSNLDDDGDYRPGRRAIAELEIKSPLRDAMLTKKEIREISRYLDLPTWNKQSCACLASRFVYGDAVTPEKLAMADRAEQLLYDLGFRQMRVRIHGSLARIEVPREEFPMVLQHQDVIISELKHLGFTYITMDLQGYRTGSMNETLKKTERAPE